MNCFKGNSFDINDNSIVFKDNSFVFKDLFLSLKTNIWKAVLAGKHYLSLKANKLSLKTN